jgi:hypothetical protein
VTNGATLRKLSYGEDTEYSAVSNLETPGSNHRHCEGRRPVAIQKAVWIATSRSPSNDDFIPMFPKLLTAEYSQLAVAQGLADRFQGIRGSADKSIRRDEAPMKHSEKGRLSTAFFKSPGQRISFRTVRSSSRRSCDRQRSG